MPSKLRKALGAVKDQTSLGLAKVSNNASTLDIAILKATSHDEIPTDERYVNEVLQLVASNRAFAASCAQAIGKRIGKTRNWIVALKSLMLVLRIFQDGDPYFPREVLHAMKRGSKILNLSNFRDDSNSGPWDYTAFVRTFALYLDERLDCFLTGKLQRRLATREREKNKQRSSHRRTNEPVRDMKPPMLIDRISHWQKLLDRAIATRPTGAAKTNKLVQNSLYTVVQESFDLYRDISDGLALLLDSFFHLQYQSCVSAFQTCVKASKQFEELCSFYTLCKSIGVGRTSEYPSVQKISDELVETLQEFLKDQASFPTTNRSPPRYLALPAPPLPSSSTSKDAGSNSEKGESHEESEVSESTTEQLSELGSQQTSLEDLISVSDFGTSPSMSIDQENNNSEQLNRQSFTKDFIGVNDSCSLSSTQHEHKASSSLSKTTMFDIWLQQQHKQEVEKKNLRPDSTKTPTECWELALAETTTKSAQEGPQASSTGILSNNIFDDLYSQSLIPHNAYNPFLLDPTELTAIPTESNAIPTATPTADTAGTANAQPAAAVFPSTDLFSVEPTFQAKPTFCAKNPNEAMALQDENDPFASSPTSMAGDEQKLIGSINQTNMQHEQQLWLQHQNKIIAKHIT